MREGRVLYQVSGSPMMVLCGTVSAYRVLSDGMTGKAMAELVEPG